MAIGAIEQEDFDGGRNFRIAEKTAVRKLLREMTGDDSLQILYEESGKPLLSDGRQISISHTRGYAAIIIADRPVGIDIEYMSDRVGRITSKFVREDEKADSTLSQLLLWSAKETVFKLFSADRLAYFDMKAEPVELPEPSDSKGSGIMKIQNLKRDIPQTVKFEYNEHFVLTFAFFC